MQSIRHNDEVDDELAVCNLKSEPAQSVNAFRIKEAFLTLECSLHQTVPIENSSQTLFIGRVFHAALDERYAHGIDEKYGANGFFFNIHSPVDLTLGRCAPVGVGTLKIERTL